MKWQGTRVKAEGATGAEKPVRILFVCLGNICRSPTAEAVLRHLAENDGLAGRLEIDSAGTGEWHIGRPPDPRACDAAARRGYDLSALRGRQVTRDDFARFDYVLAMDDENVRTLRRLCPAEHAYKVRLFTEFSSSGADSVPDPYGGELHGFEIVLDLVEDSARGLMRHLKRQLDL